MQVVKQTENPFGRQLRKPQLTGKLKQGNVLKPPGFFPGVQPVQQNIGDTSSKQLSVNGIGCGSKESLHV
jgi:hypothetical protein